jgi:hypothetical protein
MRTEGTNMWIKLVLRMIRMRMIPENRSDGSRNKDKDGGDMKR